MDEHSEEKEEHIKGKKLREKIILLIYHQTTISHQNSMIATTEESEM